MRPGGIAGLQGMQLFLGDVKKLQVGRVPVEQERKENAEFYSRLALEQNNGVPA